LSGEPPYGLPRGAAAECGSLRKHGESLGSGAWCSIFVLHPTGV
jgi:hypothetical protein